MSKTVKLAVKRNQPAHHRGQPGSDDRCSVREAMQAVPPSKYNRPFGWRRDHDPAGRYQRNNHTRDQVANTRNANEDAIQNDPEGGM
ncbi:MAG TPA: hypothetical protein VHG27_02980 [Xanthobacteraceae bacterium]|nr:hypothetical protein [Xanthobacteraceae bacterium]